MREGGRDDSCRCDKSDVVVVVAQVEPEDEDDVSTEGADTVRRLWVGRAVGSVGAGLSLFVCWRLRLRKEAQPDRRPSLSMLGSLPAIDRAVSFKQVEVRR